VVPQLRKQPLERLTQKDNINIDCGKTDTRIVPNGELLHVQWSGFAKRVFNLTINIYL
jgi:hypothetical protein